MADALTIRQFIEFLVCKHLNKPNKDITGKEKVDALEKILSAKDRKPTEISTDEDLINGISGLLGKLNGLVHIQGKPKCQFPEVPPIILKLTPTEHAVIDLLKRCV